MRVAWVFPQHQRCGIAMYSQRCGAQLRSFVDISCIDPIDLRNRQLREKVAKDNDLIHIQYETSLYFDGRHDWYWNIAKSFKKPIVVTLHEVYDEFPGVYPRASIRGFGPVGTLKRLLYDFRHPARTAYFRCLRRAFQARKILVHHRFQQELLRTRGLSESCMELIPYPVYKSQIVPADRARSSEISLGSTGFINPQFDYELLMSVLSEIKLPWTFTWAGGVRRDEDRVLLKKIEEEAAHRGWSGRFKVTGWIEPDERDRLVASFDMILALFTSRSSSESIATAVGIGVPVIATHIPLTEELAREGAVQLAPEASAGAIARLIENNATESSLRDVVLSSQRAYREQHDPRCTAEHIVALYRSLVLP